MFRVVGPGYVNETQIKSALLGSYPIAARDLSGGRVVMLTEDGADYPLLSMLDDGDAILGITTGAVVAGSRVEYRHEGWMSDPSWSWSTGPIFCGGSGVLVQSPPAGLWIRQVGEAVSATEIQVHLFPTYYRQGA